MLTSQLEFPSVAFADLLTRTRRTGILPTVDEQAGLSGGDVEMLASAWMEGMTKTSEAIRKAEVAAFAARGWAFRWFSTWNPTEAKDIALSDVVEEALDVVDRDYHAIAKCGLDDPRDMGIVQVSRFQKSEGIAVKREPYGTLILISVYCVVGPRNFDAVAGTVEFEPGSRSHALHLVYDALPSVDRLAGDIAAYPLISRVENRKCRNHGIWMGEGWTGTWATRPWLHKPWDTIAAPAGLRAA